MSSSTFICMNTRDRSLILAAVLLASPASSLASAQARNAMLARTPPSVQIPNPPSGGVPLVPDRGKPVLTPTVPGKPDTGIQLGHYHPSLPTALVGWAFAWELSGRKPATDPADIAKLRDLTALWDEFLRVDRELRANEDSAMARMNHEALGAVTDRDNPERLAIVSRYLMAQAATSLAQVNRARHGVESMAASAKARGIDDDRISTALRLGLAVASLQLAHGLVDGGGLPAADVDLFTHTIELIEALRLEGERPTEDELRPLWDALSHYALAVGESQAERLDAAVAVGAKGAESGRPTAPTAERKAASFLGWRLHLEQVSWLPRLLDAMPARLRQRAEPEFLATVAPDQFPDKRSMAEIIRGRSVAPMDSPEQAIEVQRLAAWFEDAYRDASLAVLKAYSGERATLFAPSGTSRPPRDHAQAQLAEALQRRDDSNRVAAEWLARIDPSLDLEAARAEVDIASHQLEGELNRRRLTRRFAPPPKDSQPTGNSAPSQ